MPHDFRESYGPTALVTGATSGLGRAFAEDLGERGFNLVLPGRSVDRLEVLAERLEDRYRISVMPLEVDLADTGAATRILDATATLDIGLFVSSAGFGDRGAFGQGDPAVMADMLTVNCHAVMMLAHGLVPRMKMRGRGGVILTAQAEELINSPGSAVQSATQAFVHALGKALWGELTPQGIDVLTLCPDPAQSEPTGTQGLAPAASADQHMPGAMVTRSLDNLGKGPILLPHSH